SFTTSHTTQTYTPSLHDALPISIVALVSGGNFDFERLPDVKERALRFEGLKKYFIIRLPQRPGALRDFLQMLGPDDDISRFEYLDRKSTRLNSSHVKISYAVFCF